MKALFVFILIFSCSSFWAQETPKTGALAEPKPISCFADCGVAEFPGGHKALMQFLADNIKYPSCLGDVSYSSRVYVKFIVTETGKVVAPEIVRGAVDCPECDEEVLRVIKLMPDWIPAQNQGKPVNSYFNLPVRFCL
jgi:protein TonB